MLSRLVSNSFPQVILPHQAPRVLGYGHEPLQLAPLISKVFHCILKIQRLLLSRKGSMKKYFTKENRKEGNQKNPNEFNLCHFLGHRSNQCLFFWALLLAAPALDMGVRFILLVLLFLSWLLLFLLIRNCFQIHDVTSHSPHWMKRGFILQNSVRLSESQQNQLPFSGIDTKVPTDRILYFS